MDDGTRGAAVPLLPPRWRLVKGLLFGVLVGEVLLAAALRADRVRGFAHGERSWQAWLGLVGAAYLLVVIYVLARVAGTCTRMLRELDRRDKALAAHAATSAEWLWETTPDLVVTYSSRQVEELLGYSPVELVGRDAHDFMTGPSAATSREALARGALTQGWRDQESDWFHADGRVLRLRHSAAPMYSASGSLIGYRGSGGAASSARRDAARLAAQRVRLQDVLDTRALVMAYQPIIDARTRALVGVEALARFADGRPPNIWFDEAGEVGLRRELEIVAVESALGVLSALPPAASVSINASPEVITDAWFATMLATCGAPLDRLVLEITEHVRIDQYDVLEASLAALRAGGMRVAVDDAGAGYASLAHVLRLRPDIIKLDRSLVADAPSDRARRTLIMAFTLLAGDIGALVTAEGVETAAELETVIDLGVDHVQGYFVGRPSTVPEDWSRLAVPYP
jgi:PAS domain S-box-containing protein